MKQGRKSLTLAPTDLSNYLSCHHLTQLDLRAARGLVKRPVRHGPLLDELKARGMAHEKSYLEHLKARGLSVAEPADPQDADAAAGVERTVAAMRDGVDVIYQAALADETWSARADFLLRVNTPSDFGDCPTR
jgi:uncharacterized protein